MGLFGFNITIGSAVKHILTLVIKSCHNSTIICHRFFKDIRIQLSYLTFHLKLVIKKTKKTLGDRAFQVAAPFLWNKLPRSAREATNFEFFKTLIKAFLFKETFQLS